MKKILIDVLLGLLVIVLVLGAEFLVTLPFTEMADPEDPERWKQLINRELLLGSFPAFLITFLLAWLRRTVGLVEGIIRGSLWEGAVLLFYLAIGLNNGNLLLIFSSVGLYILALGVFAGPLAAGLIRKKTRTE